MASVSIASVNKSFGSHPVIKDVSVEIADGEFVILVGPSGCGKSTLLRIIAGLETINSGTLAIGDRRVNDVEPKDRDIAMVFQNYALYPHMTVAANMAFSLVQRGVAKAEVERHVHEAAAILEIEPLLSRYPKQLSGGQRQRVAMGRAIVRNPKVFLFDEPLSNLDAKLRVQMRGEIKALHHRLATTMIYVTHDQIEAMTMADRIVVLRDGKVEQIGSPLDLYDHPVNLFVAGFLGSNGMAFFRGNYRDGQFVSSDGLKLPFATRGDLEGRDVVCGVRPDDFILTDDGVDATVDVLEPTGSETQMLARWGSQKFTSLFRGRLTAPPGSSVRLGIAPGRAHVFDAESGLRLDGQPPCHA
ncbi:ABC transporter ATP-binding protein [Pleomorphomonas oryzae]|uniref:ABC transporter ATP-binding protein n=1 Tax=Pleomorphomonas oryzae TaxID=261934 RepID=UPI000411B988|nr:sn-glycerol-3-phosphate ABC transporter ATP-binding protein UgpC [Pleomorphomonas oryzae]